MLVVPINVRVCPRSLVVSQVTWGVGHDKRLSLDIAIVFDRILLFYN